MGVYLWIKPAGRDVWVLESGTRMAVLVRIR
jgi:hypothetical protein